MNKQGYFEPTDIRTGKAPEHQRNAIRIKGNELSNAEMVPIITVQEIHSWRRPKGYWNEKSTISEIEPVIKKIIHFPTNIDLRNMNRKHLIYAISKWIQKDHYINLDEF